MLRAIDVQFFSSTITNRALQALGQHCRALRTLRVAALGARMTEQGLRAVVDGCPLLRDLALDVYWSDPMLLTLAQHCRGLKSLQLQPLNFEVIGITDAGVTALVTHCTQLRELRITAAADLTAEIVRVIAAHCKLLRGLTFVSCEAISCSRRAWYRPLFDADVALEII
jgi:hypothetical protein